MQGPAALAGVEGQSPSPPEAASPFPKAQTPG